jgi:hypothetical protein
LYWANVQFTCRRIPQVFERFGMSYAAEREADLFGRVATLRQRDIRGKIVPREIGRLLRLAQGQPFDARAVGGA